MGPSRDGCVIPMHCTIINRSEQGTGAVASHDAVAIRLLAEDMNPTNEHTISVSADAELEALLALFGDDSERAAFTRVSADAVPQPYARLLVHDGHMTVTLEDYHGGAVHLTVHETRRLEHDYARKITLQAAPGGPAVLLGIMRFDLRRCTDATREMIVGGQTPLGRILIDQDVMRRLSSGPYYRIDGRREGLLGLSIPWPPTPYARLARIDCNGGAAVQLLEIISAV